MFWKFKTIRCEFPGNFRIRILGDFYIFRTSFRNSEKIIMIIAELWSRNVKHQQKIENQTVKLRKCLTKFSRLFECGAVQLISVVPTSAGRAACTCALPFRGSLRHSWCGWIASFPGHCVLCPEDACPKHFSWFFYWIPKVQKCVNVNLCKSCGSRQ